MTIKRRISLLVAGAGLIASLLFSLAVFAELVEQPFKILDEELAEEARRAANAVALHRNTAGPIDFQGENGNGDDFWIKVFDRTSGKLYYQSKLAAAVDLPGIQPGTGTTVGVLLPSAASASGQDDRKKTTFRAKMFSFDIAGHELLVHIACSMDKLWEELRELVYALIAGLVLSSLVLIAISHWIAGRILQPIGEMETLAKKISEKNLEQRLPAGPENDEFNALARTINRMLDRLQYSFEKQRNFLFDTSHELKTPLTTMRLAVEEACSSGLEQFSDTTRENLLRLNEQVRRMDRLVKNLLNLSALEMADTIEPQLFSLKSIIEPLVDEYRLLSQERRIRIDLRLPELGNIMGDAEKLTRAFSNLLDNAIRYNHDGGTVTIEADQAEGTADLCFSNTGPGVIETDIAKVFDPFFRVEQSRSVEHGGAGLGLAMVKRIVILHGGSVRMESQTGMWTRVRITLPLLQRPEKKIYETS